MQRFRIVKIRLVSGELRDLALIRLENNVAFVCSLERAESSDDVENWIVGFPLSDLKDGKIGTATNARHP